MLARARKSRLWGRAGGVLRRVRQAIGRTARAAGRRLNRLTGGRLARLWTRVRRRRANQSPADTDPATPPDTAAAPVTTPTAITEPPASWTTRSSGETVMSDFALVTHATELPTIAARYESEDMMQVRGHLQLLSELPLAAAAAIRLLTERLAAEYPLHENVVEELRRVHDALSAAGQACDEVATTFEASHEVEITRRMQPRVGEEKWDQRVGG
ncbi:hypothetical protein [Nonomuraea soli]|uniref:Uncharacterized protein n=1 Tax=Nonomuraea soli TaxID=1032476 RepID=A0A7W0CU54_9ACTN|nr:hypothetical protein [Nonomuraea soli]MBA2897409.1 hypothetical protein [Nonomuraea soli]